MGAFNATVAEELKQLKFTDLVFNLKFYQFLDDPTQAIDISRHGHRLQSCAQGVDTHSEQNCERAVFMVPSMGLLQGTDLMRRADHSEAEAYVAEGTQGYVLRYQQGSQSDYNTARDCRVYSFLPAAFRLCIRNSAENILDTRKFSHG